MLTETEFRGPYLKRRNVVRLVTEIFRHGWISRADLARLTNITPAAVSSICMNLDEMGLTARVGQGASSGGRRPTLIEIAKDAFYLVGLDLGLAKAIAVATDLHGNVLDREEVKFAIETTRDEVVDIAVDTILRLLGGKALSGKSVRGVGVSYPGLVDPGLGVGLVAPNRHDLNNLDLPDTIRKRTGLDSWIDNDGVCMTLGQARFGSGKGVSNLLGLLLGYGIGGGLVLNGEIYHGLMNAGEFGHITVAPAGPTCGCGNQGCLEVMASGAALAASAHRIVASSQRPTLIRDRADAGHTITARLIAECAQQGDAVAQELIDQAAEFIGIATADAINILDPELIVIGGGLSRIGEPLIDHIRSVVRKRSYVFAGTRSPRFELARFGNDANAIGAATLVMERVFVAGENGIAN